MAGCAVNRAQQHSPAVAASAQEYRSELADPSAKALLGFGEFRLLGAQGRWDEALAALERAEKFDPQSTYLQQALAEVYLHRQKPEKALAILQRLEMENPDSAAVQQLYGDALSLKKNYLEAIDHFKRAVQLDPDDSNPQLRLALALIQLERYAEATAILEQLDRKHPDSGVVQLSLARLYLKNKQPEKAAGTYQRLIREQPQAYQPVLEYGRMIARDDAGAAIEVYRSFLDKNPRAAVIRQQLVQLYLTQDRLPAALEQLQVLRQQYPDNSRFVSQIGLIQLEQEHWPAAEKEFRWLVNQNGTNPKNYYYLAVALAEQKKTAEAIASLEKLLDDMVNQPEAALQLAYLYQTSGHDDKAIAFLRKILDEGAWQPDLYYYLVAFLGDRKEYSQALSYALKGVEKNRKSVLLLYQLGVLYEKTAQRQKAIEVMEKVLDIDENHADALNFLAYDQAEEGKDLPLALERAKKALKIKPSGFIVDTLGWVYYKMGRYDESRVQLEKAVDMHPDDPIIAEHLGDLYRAMKLRDKAADIYRRILQHDPQARGVQEKLDGLVEGSS